MSYMKFITVFSCYFFCCYFFPSETYSQTAVAPATTRAVIIGISKYRDTEIQSLKYAEKDARDYYNFIHGPFGGNVSEDNIVLLTDSNATRKNIIKALRETFSQTGPNDVIIFFYSGHGRNGTNGSGFLSTFDTDNSEIDGSALAMSALDNFLSTPSRMKYTFIDACHAGLLSRNKKKVAKGSGLMQAQENKRLTNSLQAYIDQATGSYISMLSSQDTQESSEFEALQNGVFTHYLIKGLQGEADKFLKNTTNYNDGRVSARELSRFVEQKVSDYTKDNQIPAFGGAYSSSEIMSNLRPIAASPVSQPIIDESYNEILERKFYPNVKGYGQIKNTSNFEFECPNDTISKYIDLKLVLFEPKLAEKIEHFRLMIQKRDKNTYTILFDQLYAARPGLNKFRIRNYLAQKDYMLVIGYHLKSEMNKEYPAWECVECFSQKK